MFELCVRIYLYAIISMFLLLQLWSSIGISFLFLIRNQLSGKWTISKYNKMRSQGFLRKKESLIPPHDGPLAVRLYPSHCRVDSGLSPIRNGAAESTKKMQSQLRLHFKILLFPICRSSWRCFNKRHIYTVDITTSNSS